MQASIKPERFEEIFKNIVQERFVFFGGIALYWFLGALLLSFRNKSQIHLALNNQHTAFGDAVFPRLTYLGEEWVLVAVALIFFLKKRWKSLSFCAITFVIQTILVQICKQWIFRHSPRPRVFFQDIAPLNFVQGVEVHGYHSFPSGHTATAFAVFSIIVLFHKGALWQLIALLACLSVALSRMYLQQHFFVDIWVGSFIGLFSFWSAYMLFWIRDKPKNTRISDEK